MENMIITILEKYGTKRAHQCITSNTGYYDFMMGTKRVHVRMSSHMKDTKEDDKDYDLQVLHGSGDTWILKYGKFLFTRSGEDFIKFLDAFLLVFPEISGIVEEASGQLTETVKVFIETKTNYEELRKEYRVYRETRKSEGELEKTIEDLERELSGKNTIISNLESGMRSLKDRVKALEEDNPDFRFLTDLKNMYGKLLQDLNDGLKVVKETRKKYEQEKMLHLS